MRTAGEVLKSIRNSLGYSEREVAEKFECSQQYISILELNRQRPGKKMIKKMIESDYLMEEEEKEIWDYWKSKGGSVR